MKLSNKKLKYIKRHAGSKTPQEIAADLYLHQSAVEEAIRDLAGQGAAVSAPAKSEVSLQTVLAYIFIVLVGVMPLIIIRQIAEATKTPQAALIQTASLALLVAWFFSRGRGDVLRLGPKVLLFSSLLLIAWALVSFAWADSYRDGVERFLIWASIPVVYLLALNLLRTEKLILTFIIAVFASGVVVTLIGLLQVYTGYSKILQTAPPASTFVNKNMAMDFVVMTAPLGLYLLSRTRKLSWWWAIGICTTLMVVYVFHGKSKGAWLGMALQVALLAVYWGYHLIRKYGRQWRQWWQLLLSIPRRLFQARWMVLVVTGCMVILLVLMNLTRDPVTGRVAFSNELIKAVESAKSTIEKGDVYEQDGLSPVQPTSSNMPVSIDPSKSKLEAPGAASLGVRMVVWKNTFKMWQDHPVIGVGMGNFRVHYDLYAQAAVVDPFWPGFEWHRTHNDYLQALAELGLVGFSLLLIVLGMVAWISLKQLMRPDDTLSLVLSMALLGIAVNTFFSFPFDRTMPPLLAACFAALIARQYSLRKNGLGTSNDVKGVAMEPALQYGLGALSVVALLLVAHIQYQVVMGDVYSRKMYDANAIGDHAGVVIAADQIVSHDPHNLRPLCYKGRALMAMDRSAEAVVTLERLAQAYPVWYVGLHNLAVAYQRSHNAANAVEIAQRALRLFPQGAETYNAMACAYLDAKEYEKSEENVRKALELSPENHEYWYNLGLALYHQGKKVEAVEQMERSIQMNPEYALPYKDVGAMYRERGDIQLACERMAVALRLDPNIDQADRIRSFLVQNNYPLPEQPRKQPPPQAVPRQPRLPAMLQFADPPPAQP